MEEWTKYVLDNVENDKVLHYCISNLVKKMQYVKKALENEKNQSASILIAEMSNDIDLLNALDQKVNGKKTVVNVA